MSKFLPIWVCITGLALASCSQSDRNLARRIGAAARQDAGALVRLAALTDFAWERVYVFGPYTPQAAIDRELGFSWPAASNTGISESDAAVLLVFVDDREVVRYTVQPRSEGDFAGVRVPGGLSPAEAIFTLQVDQNGGRIFQLAHRGVRSDKPLPPAIPRSSPGG